MSKKIIIAIIAIIVMLIIILIGERNNMPWFEGTTEFVALKDRELFVKDLSEVVQIDDLKNKDIEKQINKNIRKDAEEWLDDHCKLYNHLTAPEFEDSIIYSKIDTYYTVQLLFDPNLEKADHIELFFVYDINSGERVYLDDIVEISDDFIECLVSQNDSLQEYTNDEIREMMNGSMMSEKDWIETYNINLFFKSRFFLDQDGTLVITMPIYSKGWPGGTRVEYSVWKKYKK